MNIGFMQCKIIQLLRDCLCINFLSLNDRFGCLFFHHSGFLGLTEIFWTLQRQPSPPLGIEFFYIPHLLIRVLPFHLMMDNLCHPKIQVLRNGWHYCLKQWHPCFIYLLTYTCSAHWYLILYTLTYSESPFSCEKSHESHWYCSCE